MPGISVVLLLGVLAQADTTARGIDEFRQGRFAEARVDLEKADSRDANARAFLAMTRAALQQCDGAAAEFTSNPDAILARMSGLAAVECWEGAGKSGAAFELLGSLQRRFPDDADVLYEAAKLHRSAWDEAVYSMFRKTPSSYRVNQLSAEVFETEGKYGEAVAQYTKALEKAPDALNLHFRLGRCLLLDSPSLENLLKAKAEFEAELKLSPRDAVAEYQIAQILTAQQKPDEAAAHYERALQFRPQFVEALIAVGKLRAQAGKSAEAIALYQKAIALQPENEAGHYNLMIALRNAGRTAEAMAQKKELDRLQKPPEGEFSEFLRKLGEMAPHE